MADQSWLCLVIDMSLATRQIITNKKPIKVDIIFHFVEESLKNQLPITDSADKCYNVSRNFFNDFI